MKHMIRTSALAAGMCLLLIGAGSILSAQAAETLIEPTRLESRIQTTYELSPYLRDSNIEVRVDAKGIATLSGIVTDSIDKELAEQIALGVDGITHVANDIEIRDDYVLDASASHRSFGNKVDDFSTTTAVKSKLLWSKHISGMAIQVSTRDGIVTLEGSAKSDVARELAASIAMNTNGVTEVDNRLEVVAAGAEPDIGEAVADSWITSKVISTYMYSRNLDSADIDVSTDKGVVTLEGSLHSGAEQALAIELANNIRGVVSVNSDALVLAGN